MNKLLLIAAGVLIVFLIFSKTQLIPSEILEVHNQDPYSQMDGSVGGACADKSCLTIYVAPWCPACKKLKPTIISLTNELQLEGINVKVIVGKDELKTTKEYADKYPFPVLLDPDGKFFNKTSQRGVPFFLVSNRKGEITNEMSGGIPDVDRMRKKLNL